MRPRREGLLTAAIILAGVLLILAGIFIWAVLFFRATL